MSKNIIKFVWPVWEPVEEMGRGAYGSVYKVVRSDNGITSSSAVKIIVIPQDESEVKALYAEGMTVDETKAYFKNIVDEFVVEIKLMETFKGMQNIVSIEDYQVVPSDDGVGWSILVRMELLTPFNEYIRTHKMTESDIIRLGCDICTALEVCSKKNIIHRDIKPENIFVNDFDCFKLGDFGIAKRFENVMASHSQKGTYNYMAPEVAKGSHYDARVDIYSLGIVLYRMLNNNFLPFIDEATKLDPAARKAALERRLDGEPIPYPQNASKVLADVVLKACAYNPDDRYSSATEFKKALLQVLPLVDDTDGTDEADTDEHSSPVIREMTVSVRRNRPQSTDADSEGDGTMRVRRKAQTENVNLTKKPKKSAFPVVLLIVLILLIGGLLAYFILSNKDKDKQASTNNDNHVIHQSDTAASESADSTPEPEEIKQMKMPDLKGKTLKSAKNALKDSGAEIVVEYKVDKDAKEGTVIAQSIKSGKTVTENDTVILTICSKEETIEVKDVTGKTEETAKKTLEEQGFKVKTVKQYDPKVAEGKVINQDPPAGTSQIKDTEITIYVSKGQLSLTITLNPDGGTVSVSTLTVLCGQKMGTLPAPKRTGYTFEGWYTKKDGGSKVKTSTIVTAESDYTLYAHWTVQKFTVTFNANGGSVSPKSKTVEYGKTYGTLPTPKKGSLYFDGWFTAKSGGNQVFSSDRVTANITLYAHWTDKSWSAWQDKKPTGSGIVVEERTVYRYRDKQLTTSTNKSMSGWTLYDQKYSDWSSWSSWTTTKPTSSNDVQVESKTQYSYRTSHIEDVWSEWSSWQDDRVTANDKTEVEIRTLYAYYYYVCPMCGAHMPFCNRTCEKNNGGCGEGYISSSSKHTAWYSDSWSGAQSWYGTGYSYRKINGEIWFTDTSMPNKTQYRYRTMTEKTVWSEWSAWSDTAVTATSTKEVRTRTVYRYRERHMVYYFYKWSNWSSWTTSQPTSNSNREIQSKKQYRYRNK